MSIQEQKKEDHGSGRKLLHRRSIDCAGYKRQDGLWDVEITMADRKPEDFPLADSVRLADQAMHHMTIRVSFDQDYVVRDVIANSLTTPYPGVCDRIESDYRKIIGLSLLKGFRSAVNGLLGGVAGCTHLTEMLHLAPTIAIQSRVEKDWRVRPREGRPYEIDGCHALQESGSVVKKIYPQWWKPSGDS